ncbi:centrosomal protein of 112 kDa isoform X2 [Syngnathus scovelli]|uniref:centrosomal protein of 112 kDa isoform X2 n=1 Tax=Syngnathus scovelli TaxID=161590 RepID=UPI00211072E3|nr:centrosomal protein of 112 kDa isoform X2 [Syngnathus scovelli]
MHQNEGSLEKLNSELNSFVVEMKPYVLKHPNKTERQHCASWVKKLCEPATCSSSLASHENRNLHARLLLHMLKRGLLEGPFASKPQRGSLKSLPAYMSIYFDEPPIGGSLECSKVTLPDWVASELVDGTHDNLAIPLREDKSASAPSTAFPRSGQVTETPREAGASGPREPLAIREAKAVDMGQTSPANSNPEARFNGWNPAMENPKYLREKMIPLSPIFKSSSVRSATLTDDVHLRLLESKQVDLKVLESKHQEEKLRMQQRHEADVDQILHQRNVELDELKSRYRAQQKESEEMIHKLKWKVQSVLKESEVIRESKDKQIAELKKMTDLSADGLKNEWEKKLLASVAEVEKEKFQLQKQHTDNIQELLESTKRRLAKMEADYYAHSQSTAQTLHELEQQVAEQVAQTEKSNASLHKAMREKAQLEVALAAVGAQLHEANTRLAALHKEKDEQSVSFEETLRKFRAKSEADVERLRGEHALAAAKATEVMEDFEKILAELKQQLLVSEHQHQTQVRDQDLKAQEEKAKLQISYDKKVLVLHNEAEEERSQAKMKIDKLEEALKDAKKQLDESRESHKLHLRRADAALEQLRSRVKLSSDQAEAQLKLQMEKMEEELQHSRCLRENQSKEFSLQLDAIRQKHQQQMGEQRMQHEQEQARLRQQHCAQKDSLVLERQREVRSLESRARAALHAHQERSQEWRKRDGQIISELEAQLRILREELRATRGQHERQLAEMAALREEEKQKAHLDNQALFSHTEGILRDLKQSYQQEKETAQEKANSSLKHIEKEYSQTLARSAKIIAELQQSVCNAKEEAVALRRAMEMQRNEADHQREQDRRDLSQQAEQANQVNQALQEKVESLQRRLRSSEKMLLGKELKSQEKVTTVCREYEEKMKGLIPAELRQELEDTVASLKAQVNYLQRRADILQESSDACCNNRLPTR